MKRAIASAPCLVALAGILAAPSVLHARDAGAATPRDMRIPRAIATPGSLLLDLAMQPEPQPEQKTPPEAPAAPTAPPAQPAAAADDAAELSKKLSNPVANLISIPFQFNYDEGFGERDAGQLLLNIQPVIPFGLSEDWNLITRTIVPVINRESVSPTIDDVFGMGDIVQSFFFSPVKPVKGWIIGAGPVFNWPTTTSSQLGSRDWGAGPTIVALRQDEGWTYGILANHIWSFAGPEGEPDINSTFLQPFVSHTWPTATSITFNTESTYDWTSHEWTVPLNLVLGQIIKFGKLPVQLQLGGRYYVASPPGGPEWGIRFGFTILLPR